MILVRNPQIKKVQLKVDPLSTTVADIKKSIADAKGVPVEQQEMYYKSLRPLKDDQILYNYKILSHGETLHMMRESRSRLGVCFEYIFV